MTAPPVSVTVSRCRALCATVGAADPVVVAGGRHSGRAGVLLRTAAAHQGHHVVRLSCGTTTRISMAYVHRAGCTLSG